MSDHDDVTAALEAERAADAAAAPPPEPAQAAEPEPQGALASAEPAATAEKADPPQPHNVPFAVLKEERERRQTLERNQAVLEGRLQQLAEAYKAHFEAPAAPKPVEPEPAEPVYQDDPAAWLRWNQDRLERQVKETAGWRAEAEAKARAEAEVRQRAEQQQRFMASYQAQAAEFAAGAQDFPAAYQHLMRSLHGELQAMGVSDPTARQQQIVNWELSLAAQAMQAGRNPAEGLYQIAKMRGFAGGQPAAGNGAAPAQPAATVDPTQAARRAAAQKSLSTASGTAATPLDLSSLARMSEEEFGSRVKDRDEFRKLMMALERAG